MKRGAQSTLSVEGQQTPGQFSNALRQVEDLSAVTARHYLTDLRQFIAWCECSWREEWNEAPSTLQAVTPPILIRYRRSLQTTLLLEPSSINRAIMSLKRYFAWATKTQVIQQDPTSTVKFVPRHLDDDEEGELIAAVNTTDTLRDRTIIILLFHTGLRARELYTLTRQQMHVGKQNGTLCSICKRYKVRDVFLNAAARSILSAYLETLPEESMYLFLSEKTQEVLTERAVGHLIAKYAKLAHLINLSPHDLRHRFSYRMAEMGPLHRLAQIKGHDSLDTTMLYIRGTKQDLQHDVEKIAWT